MCVYMCVSMCARCVSMCSVCLCVCTVQMNTKALCMNVYVRVTPFLVDHSTLLTEARSLSQAHSLEWLV